MRRDGKAEVTTSLLVPKAALGLGPLCWALHRHSKSLWPQACHFISVPRTWSLAVIRASGTMLLISPDLLPNEPKLPTLCLLQQAPMLPPTVRIALLCLSREKRKTRMMLFCFSSPTARENTSFFFSPSFF